MYRRQREAAAAAVWRHRIERIMAHQRKQRTPPLTLLLPTLSRIAGKSGRQLRRLNGYKTVTASPIFANSELPPPNIATRPAFQTLWRRAVMVGHAVDIDIHLFNRRAPFITPRVAPKKGNAHLRCGQRFDERRSQLRDLTPPIFSAEIGPLQQVEHQAIGMKRMHFSFFPCSPHPAFFVFLNNANGIENYLYFQ